MKKSIAFLILSGLMIMVFSFVSHAQEPDTSKSKRAKVVLKIKKDNKGMTTVIDTVFNLSAPGGQKEFEEAMKQYETEMDRLDDELKNIEVYVDIHDLSDSLISDSLIKHLKIIEKDKGCHRFRWDTEPYGFDYGFEYPCLPDIDAYYFGDNEELEEYYMPRHYMRNFQFDNRNQTLSDLLGDIPMERVKSYKIKDRKNGKQIIIELEDGPIIEKSNRVIIIREPGKSSGKKNEYNRQMKVIIDSDDEKESTKLKK